MKIYKLLLIFTIVLIIVVTLYLHLTVNIKMSVVDNSSHSVNSNSNHSIINHSIVNTNTTLNYDIYINNSSESLSPPNGDYIFKHINWSKYPSIERLNVQDNEVSGPNSVINHTHIWFSVNVNVKDPENTQELYREMAGVVIEIRQMIGPDSTPDVWGLVGGIERYHVGMMPFEDRIYASDHYHPQAYKNEIYLIPGADIYDYHSYTLINNSVVEN